MKYLYLFIISLFSAVSLSQGEYNGQFSLYGTADIPVRSQMPRMSTNYGAGMQFAYKPVKTFPLFIELRGSIGSYHSKTSQEIFIFGDGTATVTDVTFKSGMNKVQLGTKFYYTSFYRPVRGYVTPQIGYNFMRSCIRIADPEDEDDCMPLENRIAHKSSALTYGLEVGVEVDVIGLIRGGDFSKSRLYLSASYLGSFKKTDYINTRFMNEHEHVVYDGTHGHHVDADGRALTAQFVNVSNNDLHEHKIAEIYQTHLRFININIGYVWYF